MGRPRSRRSKTRRASKRLPEEFYYLTRLFWNGSFEDVEADLDKWISRAVRSLDAQRKSVSQVFLDDILGRTLPDEELQRIWNSSGAS